MSSKRYSEEFEIEAVKQITKGGYAVADVARRLGTTTHSLYTWREKYGHPAMSERPCQKAEIMWRNFLTS